MPGEGRLSLARMSGLLRWRVWGLQGAQRHTAFAVEYSPPLPVSLGGNFHRAQGWIMVLGL